MRLQSKWGVASGKWQVKPGLAWAVIAGMLLLSAAPSEAQIFHKKKKVNKSTSVENNAQPDKILYDKAMDDVKHGRHEVGRLNLQTLINTYPDSEYLAKAKLAIADSYYREGGTANTTQAVQAYKDFGVFFPMLPEAAYAQLQVAMAHYRQMEKPDRDRTQAREAEDEFQTFLQKYPNDPLVGKAEQHLREVQEVLAEGDYRIGYFYYYTKGDKRAAASRLMLVAGRYPLYSKADHALWMLGSIWEGSEKKEIAVPFYARLVRDYPLSPLAAKAKERLTALKAPVPQADPKAVAWMTAEQNAPRPHDSFVKRPLKLVQTNPKGELRLAARTGKPTMTPESDNEEGVDILTAGNGSRIGSGPGNSIVANVTPGGTASATEGTESVAPAGTASEPKAEGQPDGAAPATSDPNAAAPAAGTSEATPKTDAPAGATNQTSDAPKTDAAPAQDTTQAGSKDDKKKESSSKKKKGLRKIIPW